MSLFEFDEVRARSPWLRPSRSATGSGHGVHAPGKMSDVKRNGDVCVGKAMELDPLILSTQIERPG